MASSVLLLCAQRLPRRVCSSCKEPYHPSKELVEQLGLDPKGKYAKGKGCAKCRKSGLIGRVGLLEAIPMFPELRRLVEQGASAVKLREAARRKGHLSLRDHAIAKAAAGVISLEEVARTTVGYQD